MPTNTNAYNSRVTDEALEKRFRDTFRSQGGAELVDDLYAQGVIVPVVDFTAAATGDVLPESLQQAWDSSTGSAQVINTTSTLITNSGFWKVDLTFGDADFQSGGASGIRGRVFIDDGSTETNIWALSRGSGTGDPAVALAEGSFIVFLRSGDSLKGVSTAVNCVLDIWYRQVATVNGDLVNPSGFTSS